MHCIILCCFNSRGGPHTILWNDDNDDDEDDDDADKDDDDEEDDDDDDNDVYNLHHPDCRHSDHWVQPCISPNFSSHGFFSFQV